MASESITANMSKETEIKLLAMSYISGKGTDSALEFVKLYRQAQNEIKAAYEETEPELNLNSLL